MAAAIVLLTHDGKRSLDDDVRPFIPELPQYERPITVLQRLHHISGVRDYIGLARLTGMPFHDVTTPDHAQRTEVGLSAPPQYFSAQHDHRCNK